MKPDQNAPNSYQVNPFFMHLTHTTTYVPLLLEEAKDFIGNSLGMGTSNYSTIQGIQHENSFFTTTGATENVRYSKSKTCKAC